MLANVHRLGITSYEMFLLGRNTNLSRGVIASPYPAIVRFEGVIRRDIPEIKLNAGRPRNLDDVGIREILD